MQQRILTLSFFIAAFFLNYSSLAQNQIFFQVDHVPVEEGQSVGIRGSQPPLSWDKSIPLEQAGSKYQTVISFANSIKEVEFKFVVFSDDKKPTWENTENRSLTLPSRKGPLSKHTWNVDQLIDIKSLGKIQPEALMADYPLIEKMAKEIHPGTFRYNSQEEIDAALAELKQAFQKPLTHGEAYLAMSKLTATLKCDHTKVGFNNQNKIINSVIHRQKDKLPFSFKWVDGMMVVVYDASKSQKLPRGTKVLKINGVRTDEIKRKMMPYIAADGATDQNRIYKIGVEGYDFRYNAFDVFFPLLFPSNSPKLSLAIIHPSVQGIENITVSPLTREKRSEILASRYEEFPKTRDDMWKFEIRDDTTGFLQLNSFGLMGWKKMTIDYKKFLKDAFTELKEKEIKYLVIDIRKNNGGIDEMKDELFTYLAPSERKEYTIKREGRTRYQQFPEDLKPYIQTWGDNPWYFNLEPDRKDEETGYYIFEDKNEKGDAKPNKLAFTGKIYLLTSPANTSLAFYTAHHFKYANLGTVVGRETGGNLNDINGGQILFLRLPNSKIEIDFPIMGGFALEKQPNSGVVPDEVIPLTYDDLLENKDPEWEWVKNNIRNIEEN